MKRVIALFATSVAILCMSGCQTKRLQSETPGAQGQDEAQGAPAWKIKLESQCATGAPEQCVAGYGFTVLADGRYHVGPGPDGQSLTNTLAVEDFKPVEELVNALINTIRVEVEPQEICSAYTQGEASDKIVLNRGGRENSLVKFSGTEFCYTTATLQEAEALHQALRELAKKHYPRPFPDACLDAASAAEALYPALRGCSTDAECSYVDSAFAPIAPGELQFVVIDDCSVQKPLVVGNAAAVSTSQEQLFKAREKTRAVCGDRMGRLGCTGSVGFQANLAAPVCSAGVCSVNPAISIP